METLKDAATDLTATKAALDKKIASPSLLLHFVKKTAFLLASVADPILRGVIVSAIPVSKLQEIVLRAERLGFNGLEHWLDDDTIQVDPDALTPLVESVHEAVHVEVNALASRLGHPALASIVSGLVDKAIETGVEYLPQAPKVGAFSSTIES